MDLLKDIFSFGSGMTWGALLFRTLILIAGYWALKTIQGRLRQGGFFGNYQELFQRVVDLILVFFEPIAAMVIVASALQLNSGFGLLFLLLLLLAGYQRLRDYFYGILLHLNPSFSIGQQLRSPAGNGTISRQLRLGVQLQSSAGQQFVPYGHLYRDGYTLEGSEQSTNFVTLEVKPQEDDTELDTSQLLARLASLPYLDDRHPSESLRTRGPKNKLRVRLALVEADYLFELTSLLEEWGYRYNILQK